MSAPQSNSHKKNSGSWKKPSHSSNSHSRPNSSSSSSSSYNPNLARFKRSNPGSGPHGFGGTYKKGEKGGLRPEKAEQIPLAERGLKNRPTHDESHRPSSTKRSSSIGSSLASSSTTVIKSKLRDLTRLLKKPNLDPTVKKHKEHELKQVQKALEEKQKENAADKIDAKYKTIKFYERRKILRKLAGLQRQLSTLYSKTGGDVMSAEEKQIRKEIAKWQLDADYIDYYPRGEKYISLFRSAASKGDDDEHDHEADSEDESGSKSKSSSVEPLSAEAAAASQALEASRAAIRKRVAAAKAAALRAEREAAGVTPAAPKRKREEEKDALFQEDDDSEEEQTETPTKSKKEKDDASDDDDHDGSEVSDELMQSDDDDEDGEDEKPSPVPAKKKQKQK